MPQEFDLSAPIGKTNRPDAPIFSSEEQAKAFEECLETYLESEAVAATCPLDGQEYSEGSIQCIRGTKSASPAKAITFENW